VIPARRASAATRPSRSANLTPVPAAAFGPAPSRLGRSMTRRSTARPASSEPAMARPSSGSAGVSTTSHSGWIPRATASTGSSAAVRSSQATMAPAACASAARRSARVVRPLEASPRIDTPMPRGTPPGPRIASSSVKPVDSTRSRSGSRSCAGPAGSGTVASAPTTSPANRSPANRSPASSGAAAPQRDRRVARAAFRSVEEAAMAPVSNICSNESRGARVGFPSNLQGAQRRQREPDRRHPPCKSVRTPDDLHVRRPPARATAIDDVAWQANLSVSVCRVPRAAPRAAPRRGPRSRRGRQGWPAGGGRGPC
jgi:hypothetical protein